MLMAAMERHTRQANNKFSQVRQSVLEGKEKGHGFWLKKKKELGQIGRKERLLGTGKSVERVSVSVNFTRRPSSCLPLLLRRRRPRRSAEEEQQQRRQSRSRRWCR
jgi:hypothetical protein